MVLPGSLNPHPPKQTQDSHLDAIFQQSDNQSINQPINQSINQSINQMTL